MLAEWLDASTYDAFLTHRRARRAFAWPRVGAISPQLFDWERLNQILAHPVAPDALVTRDGALIEAPIPRDATTARALLERGCGVVVRRAQRHDEVLQGLGDRLGRELLGTVQIQLFVTPARTRGFAWHYDGEDVLILQTVGSKTYYMRENTVVADPSRTVEFARLRDESSPLQACTLQAGDLLYLPRGMWHMGRADSTALSISLGVTPSDSQAS